MKSLAGPLTKLLIFAAVTIFVTGILATSISRIQWNSKGKFSAIFSNSTLLAKGDDVRIAGVQVGQIKSVEVYHRNLSKVTFDLQDRSVLPASTIASIRFKNLVGQRYLSLEAGANSSSTVLKSGAEIPLAQTRPALNLTDLFNGFKPLFVQLKSDDVNKLANEILTVFQGQGENIGTLVASTASLTNTVADKDKTIGELIVNLNKVLTTINQRENEFYGLLVNTQQLISGLSSDRGAITAAVTSLANLTTITNNTLAPIRPALQGDVAALKVATDNLNKRSDDLSTLFKTQVTKLSKLNRTAMFGSWFQFYLCGLDLVAGGGRGDHIMTPVPIPDINIRLYQNSATRCYADGKPQ